MARRTLSPVADLFDSLVRNALDFLTRSVALLQKHPKDSLILFCTGLEQLVKARLMLEHWALVVTKPEAADLKKFCDGDFHSVSLDEALARLQRIAGDTFGDEEVRCFRAVQQHRNKLVHFFHPEYAKKPPDAQAIQEVAKEQCKAWFYLRQLLIGPRWGPRFRRYTHAIEALNAKMERNRLHLAAVYSARLLEIEAETAQGVSFTMCFACGYHAARVGSVGDPLCLAICLVCEATRRLLLVPCPECRETIMVHDLGEEECPNEDFTTNLDWLLDTYGPVQDPKEEPTIAYCSECEVIERPTAIPFGDSLYLCLNARRSEGRSWVECAAFHEVAPRQRIVEDLESVQRGEVPPGSAPTDQWGPYLDENGRIKYLGMDLLPPHLVEFWNEKRRDLMDSLDRTVGVLRWRIGAGGVVRTAFPGGKMEWSHDGDTWHSIESRFRVRMVEVHAIVPVTEAVRQEVEGIVASGRSAPLGHELFREAWEQRESHPRSALVIGIAAAEVGFKEYATSLVASAEWLLQEIPVPPLHRMLTEYLPKLRALQGEAAARPLPAPLIDDLRKGVTLRNWAAHRGAPPPEHRVLMEVLHAVGDLPWILDSYQGFPGALVHIRSEAYRALHPEQEA